LDRNRPIFNRALIKGAQEIERVDAIRGQVLPAPTYTHDVGGDVATFFRESVDGVIVHFSNAGPVVLARTTAIGPGLFPQRRPASQSENVGIRLIENMTQLVSRAAPFISVLSTAKSPH